MDTVCTVCSILLNSFLHNKCEYNVWLTCRRCSLWALQTEGVRAIPERDCTTECVGREIYSSVDPVSAMSGQLARRYPLY